MPWTPFVVLPSIAFRTLTPDFSCQVPQIRPSSAVVECLLPPLPNTTRRAVSRAMRPRHFCHGSLPAPAQRRTTVRAAACLSRPCSAHRMPIVQPVTEAHRLSFRVFQHRPRHLAAHHLRPPPVPCRRPPPPLVPPPWITPPSAGRTPPKSLSPSRRRSSHIAQIPGASRRRQGRNLVGSVVCRA